MADSLRGSMDTAEFKQVVLGLIFFKYISDAFEERHAVLLEELDKEAADDRDIGQTVDDAVTAIERDIPASKNVLPKDSPSTRQATSRTTHRHDGQYSCW